MKLVHSHFLPDTLQSINRHTVQRTESELPKASFNNAKTKERKKESAAFLI
jgi:hypothetical protein